MFTYIVGAVIVGMLLYNNSARRAAITAAAIGVFFLLKLYPLPHTARQPHTHPLHTHTHSISERRAATHEHPGYILPFFYSLFPSYTVPHFDDPPQDGTAEHPHDA